MAFYQLSVFLKMKVIERAGFEVEEIPVPDYITENYTET